jgi:WD40 repeat protein
LLAVPTGRVVWQRRHPLHPGQNEVQVGFTSQGELVTSAQQGSTFLWDVKHGRIERRFPKGGPFSVSPDGRRLAVADNNANAASPRGSLAILDLRTGTRHDLQALPAPGWIVAVAFTSNGASIVGASFDNAVRVWDAASGLITQTYSRQGTGLNVAVAGSTVLSDGQDGSVAAWDVAGSQRLGRTFRWRSTDDSCSTAPCLVFNPQGSLMAETIGGGVFRRGSVGLVDLRRGRLVGTLPPRSGPRAEALAFLPDGRTLVTGGVNGNVTFWDVRTRSIVRTLEFPDPVWWVAASPDGKLLAVETKTDASRSSRVEVRELGTGAVLHRHVVETGAGDLIFSPDGQQLAALGCCEGGSSITVWGGARRGEAVHAEN